MNKLYRYFNCGTKTRILQLVEQSGEKAVEMVELLKKTLAENKLELSKMVSICMDNTNSIFGGQMRRGRQNVFHFLKQGKKIYIKLIKNACLLKENEKLAGIGCPAHIANNSVRWAIEQFEFPVIQFANSVTSHFSNSALRWERYTEFCEELKV